MRLGMIGMDSSRPLRVARHLRALMQSGHVLRVVVDEGDELPPGLRELAPEAEILHHPRDAIGEVDAIFDLGRRASERSERIAPLLRRGIHAFVDKPLALTRADAETLIAAAREGRAALASDSGFRQAVRRDEAREGVSVEVSGPADPQSPWGGLAFYGMHHAQMVDELGRLRGAVPVDVRVLEGVITARFESPAGQVRMVFDPGATRFRLTLDGGSTSVAPPEDYLERLVDRFLAECEAPVHDESWARRLLLPVAVLEKITDEITGTGRRPGPRRDRDHCPM